MPYLTLQEVIDRIHKGYPTGGSRRKPKRSADESHHPEFYIPRITRVLASVLFGAEAGRPSKVAS